MTRAVVCTHVDITHTTPLLPQVMSAVRNIANHNRTVICTIHSPSEAVYVRARCVV